MIKRKSLTWRAAAAAKEDAAVTDVKNLENELGLCEMKNYAKKREVSVENRNNMNTCCFHTTPPAVIIRPRKRILLHQGGRTAVFLRIAMS